MHEMTKQEGKNKIQSTFGVNTLVAPIDLSTRVASRLPPLPNTQIFEMLSYSVIKNRG